jgi:hypothetical protein
VGDAIANTYTGGVQSMIAATSFFPPQVACGGLADGAICFNTANHYPTWSQSGTLRTFSSQAGVETLANKTILSNSNLCDATTNTKCIGWSLAGAAASTTASIAESNTASRTYTFPDFSANAQMNVSLTTPASDVICALHADTVGTLTCNNAVTDGTTITPFTTGYTVPANFFTTGTSLKIVLGVSIWSSGTAPTIVLTVKAGSTVIYTDSAMAIGVSQTNAQSAVTWELTSVAAPGASVFTFTTPVSNTIGGAISGTTTNRTVPQQLATNGSLALTFSVTYSANTTGNAIKVNYFKAEVE